LFPLKLFDEEEKELEKNELNPLNDQQSVPEDLLSYATLMPFRELYCGSKGSSIDTEEMNTEIRIFKAIGDNDEEEVMSLLGEVIKDITNKLGQTLYHATVDASAFNLIEKLKKSGIDINMQDSTGKTALIYAIKKRSFAYRAFIMAEADVNQVDTHGRSALFYVTNVTQANWIIGAGARVDIVDKDGNTALHYQLIQGCPSAAEETISRFRSCCRLSNETGNNVLHIMAEMGYLTLAMKLQRTLKGKARFEDLASEQNIRGETPLALAIRNKRIPMAEFLFTLTPINVRDYRGNSYLHMVAEKKRSVAHIKVVPCFPCYRHSKRQSRDTSNDMLQNKQQKSIEKTIEAWRKFA